MAITDESSGFNVSMPVAPAYGGYGNQGGFGGFGGDWGWIILLLLCGWGGMGMGGFGGFGGGFGNMFEFPWLLNGQNGINNNVNDGFRSAQISDNITSVRDGVSNLATQLCGCCGDIQMGIAGINQNIGNSTAAIQNSLCQGFAGTTAAVTGAQNAITTQMYNNEIASLNRSFAEQTANSQGFNGVQAQLANGFCDNRAGIADLRYTVATENCADRAALSDGIRDIIAANTASTQRILDQLCQDKIDQKNDTIAQLRQELLFARGQASQDVQTAELRANNATVANQLVAELRSCPIPAQPVYGNQPIFTCPQNQYSGCGCGVA